MCYPPSCLLCSRGTPALLRRVNPTWIDVSKVVLYCLHRENPGVKYFSLKQSFYQFLIEHMFLLNVQVKAADLPHKWHKCIQDALCHRRNIFARPEKHKGKGWWGLKEMSDPWVPVDNQSLSADRPSKRIKVTTSATDAPPSPQSSPPSSPATPISPDSSAPQSPYSLSSSSEVPQPLSDDSSAPASPTFESIGTEGIIITTPASESEFDKLEREYKVVHEYLEATLTRQKRNLESFKAAVAIKESQNMERLKVLKKKIANFPDNEIAMLEVVFMEILQRTRRTNLTAALQGLVEIHGSCDSLENTAGNGNKFSINFITS